MKLEAFYDADSSATIINHTTGNLLSLKFENNESLLKNC